MSSEATTTENGAISHATTGSGVLDLFFKTVRNTPGESLNTMLANAWAESPLDTLRVIFHLRDCRGGKGERKQFHECLRWLVSSGNGRHLLTNLQHVPFYGTYKDLFAICGTEYELDALRIFANQLRVDIDALNRAKSNVDNNPAGHTSVSLAAKWAPTEGSSLDRRQNLVRKLTGLLRKQSAPVTTTVVNSAEYRKNLLTPLRAHLDVVERHMCAGDWSAINFATVPSVAMKNYRKAFGEHQKERFDKYMENVKNGTQKINAAMVFPYQLVSHYLKRGDTDAVVEEQWKAIVSAARAKYAGAGQSALAIVDVSGSMSGQPMEVAISLGMLLAEIASGPFAGKVLTFSESPNLFSLNLADSLRAKVKAMSDMNWNMTTNLMKAFDVILNTATMFRVAPENMPRTLYIFSDMQFDTACPGNTKTNFQQIEQKYANAGYVRPNIVYWNLRGDTVDFPVEKNVPNTALVSGFSQSLLEIFMDGNVISPYQAMRRAIDAPRYSKITLA